ncbi:MAG: hypothetical protein IJW21_06040 [Clostridia bacterium]|nr:hypothetical protein [Clostridia bacterium]
MKEKVIVRYDLECEKQDAEQLKAEYNAKGFYLAADEADDNGKGRLVLIRWKHVDRCDSISK